MGSRLICCHKCGVSVEEFPANRQQLARLVPKESSSKEKQVMIEAIYEPQTQLEAVHSTTDDGVDVVGLDGDDRDLGIEEDQEGERWSKRDDYG